MEKYIQSEILHANVKHCAQSVLGDRIINISWNIVLRIKFVWYLDKSILRLTNKINVKIPDMKNLE